MEIQIDSYGKLIIKRRNRWSKQTCPLLGSIYCGDWCPHFGEPTDALNNTKILEICHGKILKVPRENFTDKRRNQT